MAKLGVTGLIFSVIAGMMVALVFLSPFVKLFITTYDDPYMVRNPGEDVAVLWTLVTIFSYEGIVFGTIGLICGIVGVNRIKDEARIQSIVAFVIGAGVCGFLLFGQLSGFLL